MSAEHDQPMPDDGDDYIDRLFSEHNLIRTNSSMLYFRDQNGTPDIPPPWDELAAYLPDESLGYEKGHVSTAAVPEQKEGSAMSVPDYLARAARFLYDQVDFLRRDEPQNIELANGSHITYFPGENGQAVVVAQDQLRALRIEIDETPDSPDYQENACSNRKIYIVTRSSEDAPTVEQAVIIDASQEPTNPNPDWRNVHTQYYISEQRLIQKGNTARTISAQEIDTTLSRLLGPYNGWQKPQGIPVL